MRGVPQKNGAPVKRGAVAESECERKKVKIKWSWLLPHQQAQPTGQMH